MLLPAAIEPATLDGRVSWVAPGYARQIESGAGETNNPNPDNSLEKMLARFGIVAGGGLLAIASVFLLLGVGNGDDETSPLITQAAGVSIDQSDPEAEVQPAATGATASTTTAASFPTATTTLPVETTPLPTRHTFTSTSVAPPTTEKGTEPTTTTTEQPTAGAEGLVRSMQRALEDPGFAATEVGLQVWVEGYGPALTNAADVPLIPASNQKLATSLAALEILGPDRTFETLVLTDGSIVDGVVTGDVYVVGGADPVLTTIGEHSIETLARLVAAAGVTEIDGRLLVDESRHPIARTVAGWEEQYVPLSIGPLSAMAIDGNKPPTVEYEYYSDPMGGNAALIVQEFQLAGIAMDLESGGVATVPSGAATIELARLASPPVSVLVQRMLGPSDNTTSELLVREMGLALSGEATTAAGLAAIDETLERLLGPLEGVSRDGSGLHRGNLRPASEWWRLLAYVIESPWRTIFEEGLAVGGESGTLRRRFRETPATGKVLGKTGTIDDVRTLAGYVTTLDGRPAIFVVLANGQANRRTTLALDALVDRIAGHPG